jgi:hypothetical protein
MPSSRPRGTPHALSTAMSAIPSRGALLRYCEPAARGTTTAGASAPCGSRLYPGYMQVVLGTREKRSSSTPPCGRSDRGRRLGSRRSTASPRECRCGPGTAAFLLQRRLDQAAVDQVPTRQAFSVSQRIGLFLNLS